MWLSNRINEIKYIHTCNHMHDSKQDASDGFEDHSKVADVENPTRYIFLLKT